MKEYEGRRRMIRLSNLEDVFLQLVGDNESGPPAAQVPRGHPSAVQDAGGQ